MLNFKLNKELAICPIQYFGLGDAYFIMSIIYKWINEGYNIIWPIDSVYLSIAKHFPEIIFVNYKLINVDYNNKTQIVSGGLQTIPFRFSDSIMQVQYKNVMRAKYEMVGLNWSTWKDNFQCVRDTATEEKLFYEVFDLKDGEEYNLVSSQFTTGGKRSFPLRVTNGLKTIDMKFIEGFSMIDWMKVIENATNIFAVSSSNIYLFELFDLKCKELHLYPRIPIEIDHRNYIEILTKDYILH